jgi:hypothetical protein
MFVDKGATLETVHIPVHESRIMGDVRMRMGRALGWIEKDRRLPYLMPVWCQTKRAVAGSYSGPTVRIVRHPATGTFDEVDLLNVPIDIDADPEQQLKAALRSGQLAYQLRHVKGVYQTVSAREDNATRYVAEALPRLKQFLAQPAVAPEIKAVW